MYNQDTRAQAHSSAHTDTNSLARKRAHGHSAQRTAYARFGSLSLSMTLVISFSFLVVRVCFFPCWLSDCRFGISILYTLSMLSRLTYTNTNPNGHIHTLARSRAHTHTDRRTRTQAHTYRRTEGKCTDTFTRTHSIRLAADTIIAGIASIVK